MSASIKSSADGTQAIIQVNGVDKVVISTLGILTGALQTTSYANDAAAAAGGVLVGGLYHTAGTVKVRIV